MECASAVAMAASEGTFTASQKMLDMDAELYKEHLAQANGITNLNACVEYMKAKGFTVEFHANGSFTLDQLHNILLGDRGAGVRPIVLQLENGQALRDFVSGAADEKGLQGHGICLVGVNPQGYLAADGDNPKANETFMTYPWSVIVAAQPYAFALVDLKRAVPAPPTPTPIVPTPTADDVKTLQAELSSASARIQVLVTQLSTQSTQLAAALEAEAAIKALKSAESKI